MWVSERKVWMWNLLRWLLRGRRFYVAGYLRFRDLSVRTLESSAIMRAAFFLFLFFTLAFVWKLVALKVHSFCLSSYVSKHDGG